MSKKTAISVVRAIFLTSPFFLVLFCIIPACFVLSRFVELFRGIPLSFTVLLVNFLVLLLVIALRFVWYLMRVRSDFQYDADSRPRNEGVAVASSLTHVHQLLDGAGFRFSATGEYGEKRTSAMLGTTILYGGLLLALLVGTIDYARQYSNVVLLAVGNPAQLASPTGIILGKGYLASTADLPQLQVKKQILPNSEWPHGATEIALLSDDKKELARKTISWGGDPLKYRGYEFHMGRFLYDIGLNIVTKSGYLEFADYIRLQPGTGLKTPYTHASTFTGEQNRGKWSALYDPQRKALQLTLKNKDVTLADGEMIFHKDVKKEIDGFVVEFAGMGNWSEIHIVRSRHMYLVVLGAMLAIAGGIMRLYFRPQRVWLEEAQEGCRVWAIGKEAEKSLKTVA